MVLDEARVHLVKELREEVNQGEALSFNIKATTEKLERLDQLIKEYQQVVWE